jgi:hypothetical protein
MRILCLIALLISLTPWARAHDLCINTPCRGSSEEECETVEAIGDLSLGGYFLPASGEVISFKQALPSPDEKFHRCTWWLNKGWHGSGDGQGPEGWIVRPNNSTLDGKPRTRCFWAPMVGW